MIKRCSQFIQDGYLLPSVIILGLAISTVSIMALQTIAQNSSTLNNQSYTAIAKEAAQAGVSAAIACINSNSGIRTWGTSGGGTTTLTPKGCTATSSGNDYVVSSTDTGDYTSTYSVAPIEDVNSSTGTSSIITSTGTVYLKGPSSSKVVVATQTVRTQVKTAGMSAGDPARKTVTQVSTGPSTACAITDDDSVNDHWVYCWGDNSNMQLGNGRYIKDSVSKVPLPVYSSATTQAAISGTCTASLPIVGCVNYNPKATPAQPATAMAGKRVVKVSVGTTHTCAIAQDGTDDTTRRAYCWGKNDSGQLGDTTTNDSMIPIAVYTGTGKTRTCTGRDFFGNCTSWDMPRDATASSLRNTDGTLKTVTDISAGSNFTCALTSDGLVSCWGDNTNGQLGNTNRTDSAVPVAVSQDTSTIVRTCTHRNWLNQCDGYSTDAYDIGTNDVPASALAGKTVKQLARVKNATTMCAIGTDNYTYCWGQNYAGQTGNGKFSPTTSASSGCSGGGVAPDVPPSVEYDALRPVASLSTLAFSDITISATATASSGDNSSYTTAKDTSTNRMYWWGGSTSVTQTSTICGSSGGGTGPGVNKYIRTTKRTYVSQPTPAGTLDETSPTLPAATPLGLTSGNAYNDVFCATTGGSIICNGHGRGNTKAGQTGNGIIVKCEWYGCTPDGFATPQLVSTTQLPGNVDTGSNHTSDLTTSMAQSVTSMDTGTSGYTCAVANSAVVCWGENGNGQIGNGTTSDRFAPTYVDTSDSQALGKSGVGGGGIGVSGIAAIGSNNGLIDSSTAKSF